MGFWLDKFEQFILNYARRFISILLIVSITAVIISLVVSGIKYFDYASSSIEDNFKIPKFKKPQQPILEEIQDNKKKKKETEKKIETEENKIEETHPFPEYKEEIAEITNLLYPLYVSFYNWDNSSLTNFDKKKEIMDVASSNLKPFSKFLTNEQMDDVVNGLVKYVKNFSEFYVGKFNINENLSEIRPRNDEDFEKILRFPFKPYLDNVRANYSALKKKVKTEENNAYENNLLAKPIIIITGISASISIVLVLLLLIFKAENSLRRQADSFENTSKKE